MPQPGPYPDTPTGWRFLLPGAVKLGLVWVFFAVTMTLGTILSLATFRIGAEAYFHLIARCYAAVILKLAKIEVRVINGERLQGRKARIVTFNHSSQLDLFLMSSVLPPYSTPIGKREFYFVPFIGWFYFAMKLLAVDRRNLERAKLTLAAAARRTNEQRASVFIAPEGTRSRDGALGPFKMGPFHLAAEARVPITPVVLRGARLLQPMGVIIPRPGLVEIEIMPDVPTDDYSADNLKLKRDELREVYLRALARPAEPATVKPS
jgi:putative phosphoserine phosphatase / 1-acylglycerol-3-phosphate O-acyltransferase